MPKNDREYERLFEYYLDQHKEVLDTKIKEKIRESVEFLNNRSKKIKEEYEKKNANEKLHEEFGKFSPADIAKIINEAALEACDRDFLIILDSVKEIISLTYPLVTNEILNENEKFKIPHPHVKDANKMKS